MHEYANSKLDDKRVGTNLGLRAFGIAFLCIACFVLIVIAGRLFEVIDLSSLALRSAQVNARSVRHGEVGAVVGDGVAFGGF